MKVERLLIDDLSLDPGNARRHDDKNLKAIAGSLTQFGQLKPIVIWKNTVVAGNGTLVSARSLGWTEIDVVRIPDEWDADRVQAFALADNRTAELALWDEQVLAAQLIQLGDAGWDVAEFGFEALEPEPDVTDDEIPELPDDYVPVAKLGDVWQLGRHRLMCGDSTDSATVATLMQGTKADMAFTDPPYGVSYTGGIQFKDGVAEHHNREMIKNDDVDIYPDVFRILSEYVTGACYIWFAGTKAGSLYSSAEKYGDIHSLLIWVKNGGYGALNANYKQKHEPCLYWKPAKSTLKFVGSTTETTVWEISKDGRNEFHPTQKPIALGVKAISNHDANVVLDLFGGSGSTLIACEQINRTCLMMELDPKYVDVIIRRWESVTGLKAELLD
jgi:site-specific DNA-methyltransferase (adenine-specific)